MILINIYMGVFILNKYLDNNYNIQILPNQCTKKWKEMTKKMELLRFIGLMTEIKLKQNRTLMLEDIDFKTSLLVKKKSFNQNIEKIKAGEHPLLWKNLLFPDKISPYKLVIVDLELIYDYETSKLRNDIKLFTQLVKYCKENDILYGLIGEAHPTTILKSLNKILPEYFNLFNYITPYHYSKSFLGNPYRLNRGKINSKAISIDLNILLEDIIDEYQIPRNEMLFIGKNESVFPKSCQTEKLEEKEWIDAMEVMAEK